MIEFGATTAELPGGIPDHRLPLWPYWEGRNVGAPKHCEIAISEVADQLWLVAIRGEHDLSSAEHLGHKLREAMRPERTLIIDLSETSFLDSTTLRVLIDTDKDAQSGACRELVLIAGPETAADRLFRLVGVHRVFTILETVPQALAYLDTISGPADPATSARWSERKQRIAKNEQVFRDYNDRRLQHEAVDADDDEEPIPFVCECGDADCVEALIITASQFTDAHSAPNRFLVKPGHVYPEVEQVIEEHDAFAVVEKLRSLMRAVN